MGPVTQVFEGFDTLVWGLVLVLSVWTGVNLIVFLWLSDLKEVLWRKLGSVLDSSQLSSEKISLLTWEWWAAVNRCAKVSGKHFLDHSGGRDHVWLNIGELNPIVHDVVRDPENALIGTFASELLTRIGWILFSLQELSLGDPIILLSTLDLTEESQG